MTNPPILKWNLLLSTFIFLSPPNREIADYIDTVARQTGIAKLVGNSGGVVAGGLAVTGGVLTILTAGAAAPVLMAGAGVGLASGLTGASASISKKIIKSNQMKKVQQAIDEDAEATKDLEIQLETVQNDLTVLKVADGLISVVGIGDDAMDLLDFINGTKELNGAGIVSALDTVGKLLGESANKHIMQVVAITSGHVLAGAVNGVVGGVCMVVDMYQLKTGIQKLADGSEEGVQQIRGVTSVLVRVLNEQFLSGISRTSWRKGSGRSLELVSQTLRVRRKKRLKVRNKMSSNIISVLI